MPVDSEGVWSPNFSKKQNELREVCKRKKFVHCNGPRYSGKTIGCLGIVADHAWSTNPANITMITISQTVGMDSGIWQDLTKHVLPEWIGHFPDGRPWIGRDSDGKEIEGGNFGMEWVRPPYTQNVSKKPTVEVSNYAGGVTTIQLDSLQNEEEAEDRFKPRRYSMIYVPEFTTFHKRDTFDTWTECLRMVGLPDNKHLFLSDGNPPDSSSWFLHDLWWDLFETLECDLPGFIAEKEWPLTLDQIKALWNALARVDINVEDNPFADPNHVALLKAKYAHNDDLYRRYILGECVTTTTDSIFHEVFRPSFHIVGEPETKSNKDNCEEMFPEDDCFELMTTWDPGTSTNWATLIVEKFFPDVEKHGPSVARYNGLPCFKVLAEIMCIGEDVDAHAFVQEVLEQMRFYQGIVPRVLRWKHYSDQNVFDYKDIYGKYYSQIIHEFSEGKIALIGVVKGNQSVQTGLDLVRRLFFEERLWINAARCPVLIDAIKGIKKPKTGLGAVARGSPHKHPIDALRYLLMAECRAELSKSMMLNIKKRRAVEQKEKGTLVEVGL
jgi:hypothetical protein